MTRDYPPIDDYGVIGDMHTAALVGCDGSIDWLCFPRFDSPSVFASILDRAKGGYFRICPADDGFRSRQHYWPDTNVLITRFLSHDGAGEVTDFMPVDIADSDRDRRHVIRRVRALRGTMRFRVECEPAFNYARTPHDLKIDEHGAHFITPELTLGLVSTRPMQPSGRGGIVSEFELHEGESTAFVLGRLDDGGTCAVLLQEGEALSLVDQTVAYWRRWLAQSHYQGRWREMVHRSALTLKLMTYEPTGAIVAALTTSLPEEIGGTRNWDYRYTWLRDAAFTLYGLMRLGFVKEASQFMHWLEERIHERGEDNGTLQIMYGIDGRHDLSEESLDHLEGYRGSAPVRVGNAAFDQLQLDIYGELFDSIYLYDKYGSPISYELWTHVRDMADWLSANWRTPDHGIWEMRGGKQNFLYSRLMSWVAMDRALRLSEKRSLPGDRIAWARTRDEIMTEIMEEGWEANRKAFMQAYGSDALDAASLLMPLVFFLSPSDPQFLSTLDATMKRPDEGGLLTNGLVYRYNTLGGADGLEGNEGSFNICTFWLVEALTRAGRTDPARLEQARLLFEEMLVYSNQLGLYSEQIGPSGEALGNYPQAFTHLSLISAAYNLDRELNRSGAR